jgi:HD superfamily phosphodiesterase
MAARRRIETPEDAETLLVELGAPDRLVRHGRLVLEAADELLAQLRFLGIALDRHLVRAGALLHDAGKILHPGELSGGGAEHEPAGERLLAEHGIDLAIARCCMSHARWATMTCSLEELLVALADALWKGVRREALEKRVIDEIACRLGVSVWSVYTDLDSCFERIAEGGAERLQRSR